MARYGDDSGSTNPQGTIGKIAATAVRLGGGLAYQVLTTYPIAKLNEEGGAASKATDLLGYAIGPQNQRYVYFEIDGNGKSHFLGCTGENIKDPKKLLFEQEKTLSGPQMSDIFNTTGAIESLTNGMMGDPRYDPLFNKWKASIPSEQIRLYELYGLKETIAEVGGDSRIKSRIVRVDRFNPLNMTLSEAYWLYRDYKFKLTTYPVATRLIDLLQKTGVTTVFLAEDIFELDSRSDEVLTGIGYYPKGLPQIQSPTAAAIEKLNRAIGEMDFLYRAAHVASSPKDLEKIVADMKKLGANKDKIIKSMGIYADH